MADRQSDTVYVTDICRQTDRQTNRQTDRQTGRQAGRQADTHTHTHTHNRERERETDTHHRRPDLWRMLLGEHEHLAAHRDQRGQAPVPHENFSDLYEKMSGKGASAGGAHRSVDHIGTERYCRAAMPDTTFTDLKPALC